MEPLDAYANRVPPPIDDASNLFIFSPPRRGMGRVNTGLDP
jgi:hypothetical protein